MKPTGTFMSSRCHAASHGTNLVRYTIGMGKSNLRITCPVCSDTAESFFVDEKKKSLFKRMGQPSLKQLADLHQKIFNMA
jgi:hypothetical protein